jgi:hypothetical protein
MQSAAPFGPTRPPAVYAFGLAPHRFEEWARAESFEAGPTGANVGRCEYG